MKDVPKAIEAVWKIESTRLIAAIARVTHDIGIAEELAQDAMVTALELWPEEGIPENPGAWLMTAPKRRAIAVVACSYKSTKKSPANLNGNSSSSEMLWSTHWIR
jgi:predicted RNA polymerase sigma factor